MIKVGSFFTVNFYTDKIFIHDFSRCFVFKTFPLHYMTPVTGGISNTYQYWFIFFNCFLQSSITPGIPLNRIVCMLQQVRTGLMNQVIGKIFLLHCSMVNKFYGSDPLT